MDFCAVVEAADKAFLLRALDLVGGIVGNHVHLDCVLECPMDDRVIVDDRVGIDALKLLGIEALNIRCRQSLQCDSPLLKVGCNGALNQRSIRGVCRQLDGALGDGQPALEEVRKEHLLLQCIGLCNRDNGDYEALPLFQQKGLCALLVALYGQVSRKPRGFPFAVLVLVNSQLSVEFGASTYKNAKALYVSSCTLQEMNSNNQVIASTSLTPPDTTVNNGSDYTATANYSGTSGKRYTGKYVVEQSEEA